MLRKDLIITVLLTFCITVTLFGIIPISGQGAGDYDHWYDINDDGTIDMRDIGGVARKFGASGTAINKTELLLELEARLDLLNATVMSILENQMRAKRVVAGQVIHDSSSLPPNFVNITMPEMEGANSTNTVVVATGSKIDDATGEHTPLAITGQVTSSTTLSLQVWDVNGTPYDVASWTGNSGIEISYTVIDH